MAPVSKKSKLTMSSSSTSKPKASKKVSKPASDDGEEGGLTGLDETGGDDDDMSGLSEMDDDEGGEDDDEFDLEGVNTDDEIEGRGPAKSKKTAKRKRRATSPSTFGSLLTNILSTSATAGPSSSNSTPLPSSTTAANTALNRSQKPSKRTTSQIQSSNILSLAPSIKKTLNARQLEQKARRVLDVTRKEREDKGRITDVLEGWGGREDGVGGQDWERTLRKVAQKGVVRLFNTILTSSSQAEEESAERKTLAAPQPVADPKKHKGKDNILGRGGRDRATGGVTKEGFEALLKGGGA